MSAPTGTALRLAAVALDCPNPRALAGFYSRLLGWRIDESQSHDHWVELVDPAGGLRLAFQFAPEHLPSTWPKPERPQMMHLDVRVTNLDEGHARAMAAGARELPQPLDRLDAQFRVYTDPAGHPFCLCAP